MLTSSYQKIYKRRAGSSLPISAQVVGEYLEHVTAKHGSLTTKVLADEVEQDGPTGAVADCFTWDVHVGMRKLHEHEARQLVCAVEVIAIDRTNHQKLTAEPVRAFVNLRSGVPGEAGEYHPIVEVMSNDQLRAQLLGQAHRELESWYNRYAQFEEAVRVWETWEAARAQAPAPPKKKVKSQKPKAEAVLVG